MTIHNEAFFSEDRHWNEDNVNDLPNSIRGQVCVPAAAVIPALKVYTNIVAVKKLVVGFETVEPVCSLLHHWLPGLRQSVGPLCSSPGALGG